ncbi:hypothetical protein AG4045_009230, partial [Apium graveolens]
DWKDVDETLESLKLKEKEGPGLSDGPSFDKRSFGSGKRSERSWRKHVMWMFVHRVGPTVLCDSEHKSLMEQSTM